MNFKENLLEFLSEDEANSLIASFLNEDKHAVLLNLDKISDEDFLKLYPNVKKHPYVEHAYIYNKFEYPLGKSIYHELGYFYLQEPSAMIVSSLLDFSKDDLVLDMCAAPGGKSVGASFKMENNGLIISNDLSRSRASIIVQNAERLGRSNLIVTSNEFEEIHSQYLNKFDVIILDAPCSGSGMFRKNDRFMSEWSINKVNKFAEIQKRLILIAYEMLKPGGTLSYSTCSYSKEEDEDVVQYLLDNTDAVHRKINQIEDAYINPKQPLGIRLMPNHFEGEGQYIAHILKPGVRDKNSFYTENKYKKMLPRFLDDKYVEKFGDTYFYLPNYLKLKGLNVVRMGAKIGEEIKGIFKYDLHFARCLKENDFNSIELDLNELKLYFEGYPINKKSSYKGYTLLTYNHNPIDIAKTDGAVIKNHYPKGLRRKF